MPRPVNAVQALVDSTGNVVESYTYDAWGNILSHSRTLDLPNFFCRYLWQGREYSFATGFCNFRARWYEPTFGRWLSKDPIGLESGLNLYAFCGDDPVNFRDPWGLCEDGQKYVDQYTDLLMKNPFYLQHVLATMNEMDIWVKNRNGYQYNGSFGRATVPVADARGSLSAPSTRLYGLKVKSAGADAGRRSS